MALAVQQSSDLEREKKAQPEKIFARKGAHDMKPTRLDRQTVKEIERFLEEEMSRFSNFRRQILNLLGLPAIALLLVLSVTSPSLARMAAIETTAPLQDHSEQSIKAAVTEAVETAVRGALAMGLPWIHLRGALVLADMVTVQILATDMEPKGEEAGEPSPNDEHDLTPSQPARFDL